MSGGEGVVVLTPDADADSTAVPSGQGSTAHNRAIATGVLWQGSLRWIAQVLAWTATIAVARRLSPADYGIAGTAGLLFGLLALVTDGGLARAIVVMRARESRVVSQVYAAACLTGVALAAVMIAAAYPIAGFYSEPRIAPVIMLLSVVLLFSGANAVPLAVLQQDLKYRQIAEVEFGKTLVQGLTVLVCALSGLRYWSLAIGLIAGYVAAFLLLRRHVRLTLSTPSRETVGPIAAYASQLAVSSIAWYMYSSGDFAVVGRVAGLAALGYYQFAWNVAQLPGEKLANVLQAVVLPFFGSIGEDRAALKHYFLILSELLVAVMLPILAGFALVSPIAVPLIFGSKWLASIPVMQILVACAAMSTVSLLGQHVLGATGNAIVSVRLHVVALFVMPALFYVGARLDGPFGVAIAWLIAQPILVGYPLVKLRRAIDLPVGEYLANLRGPVVSATVMSLTVYVLRLMLGGQPPLLQLVALILAGAAVYTSVFIVFFRARVTRILSVWTDR